jgi:hypothetical protein
VARSPEQEGLLQDAQAIVLLQLGHHDVHSCVYNICSFLRVCKPGLGHLYRKGRVLCCLKFEHSGHTVTGVEDC